MSNRRSAALLGPAVVSFALYLISSSTAGATDDHAMLCEVVATPTASEFIEIANPTNTPISLDGYYLSDDASYALLPGAFGAGPTPSIAASDFIVQFPAGVVLPPGGVVVIAFDGAGFATAYGVSADLEIHGTDPGTPDMIPTDLGSTAGLTNSGENVVLFYWDNASDLVSDVDMLNLGTPSAANAIASKTGVSVDGPDADSDVSTYAADAAGMPQQAGDPGSGVSTQRIGAEAGHEASGGNGLTGDDETTENISLTWDAPPFSTPTPGACAGPAPPAAAALLLAEVVVTPTAGEYIEIHNPTAGGVDLSDYYITDATFAGSGTFYYNIVTGADAGGGAFGDFNARFPDGASIAPGEFQTLAVTGSVGFETTYGFPPTYELFEDEAAPDAVPDMREALTGSVAGQGGLTNGGEVAILYFWDGVSDLVTDVDYFVWGDKDEAVDKTGIAIDGPDPDSDPSAYLPDTAIAAQDVGSAGAHGDGSGFVRDDFSEGTQAATGGNGVGGSDQTSENLSVTWIIAEATPGGGQSLDWVVNEIHADPAPDLLGDANADGVRDSSQDEFVEIVNTSGAALDMSGWTISDAVAERHVFPAGSIVPAGCGIVVFGGGGPVGGFGGALVQTASSGGLGLNNGGDDVIVNQGGAGVATSYGSEGGNDQSLTRDPDIVGVGFSLHSAATGSGGTLFSPGSRANSSPFAGCPSVPTGNFEIYEIQGAGLASPFIGLPIATEQNVVTAVTSSGFFIQTPSARSDGDEQTSDGIFVFTGSTPSVNVGDDVDVSGVVTEYFELTELTGSPSVTINSSGKPLPPSVIFDAITPSPLQPQSATELERFEGMRVRVENGITTAATDRFGDVTVVAGSVRAYREPGVVFPGIAGLPVWDGNPEIFEIDPDGLGGPDLALDGGTSIVLAEGPLTFSFGDYQLLPETLVLGDLPALPIAVRPRKPGEFVVGEINLYRFFDAIDDPGPQDNGQVEDPLVYALRLTKFSLYLREVLGAPDIVAVSEVESLIVLQDVVAQVVLDDPSLTYTPYLEEGNDVGGIDVGFLVRNSVQVDAVTQLGRDELLSVDGSLLHDRPPLLLEGAFLTGREPFPIAVMAVHNRSLSGIDSESSGPRVRQKRLEQAQSIAEKIQDRQVASPGLPLVVTGDFNAYEFSDGYVDVVGQIRGEIDPSANLLSGPDLVDPNLTNRVLSLPEGQRYSFIFGGSAQVLDHALTSAGLDPFVTDFAFTRGNSDVAANGDQGPDARRVSDHDGLALFLLADSDLDGVPNAEDRCSATQIPESVPEILLGHRRYALTDDDGMFDTRGGWPHGHHSNPPTFTIENTAGCSCEQIIDSLNAHPVNRWFGCSRRLMKRWVRRVEHAIGQ
jgi:hypothetical protein